MWRIRQWFCKHNGGRTLWVTYRYPDMVSCDLCGKVIA